jgi:hypothetical protein
LHLSHIFPKHVLAGPSGEPAALIPLPIFQKGAHDSIMA